MELLESIKRYFWGGGERSSEKANAKPRDNQIQIITGALNKDAAPTLELPAIDDGRPDYLGRAADRKNAATAAMKAGQYDKAWRLFHEQMDCIARHYANDDSGYISTDDVTGFAARVHEDLANVLRLEGKHRLAFVHILYWVLAERRYPIKRHDQKLNAYFNRCKFAETSIEDVWKFKRNKKLRPDFRSIQAQVNVWK